MAAGQQALRVPFRPVVEADHVADRIDVHLVETAVIAHPLRQLPGDRPVRVGQVGHRQLAAFGVARVAVRRQPFGPVPDPVALFRRHAETLVQADFRDAMDVAQAFGELEIGMMREASLERRDDLRPAHAQSARTAHGKDERKAEFLVVGGVQALDVGEFLRRAGGQARTALLRRRLRGQRPGNHRPAGQLGMRAQQRELRVAAGIAHGLRQGQFQLRQAAQRTNLRGPFGNPRRVLVDALEHGDEPGG